MGTDDDPKSIFKSPTLPSLEELIIPPPPVIPEKGTVDYLALIGCAADFVSDHLSKAVNKLTLQDIEGVFEDEVLQKKLHCNLKLGFAFTLQRCSNEIRKTYLKRGIRIAKRDNSPEGKVLLRALDNPESKEPNQTPSTEQFKTFIDEQFARLGASVRIASHILRKPLEEVTLLDMESLWGVYDESKWGNFDTLCIFSEEIHHLIETGRRIVERAEQK